MHTPMTAVSRALEGPRVDPAVVALLVAAGLVEVVGRAVSAGRGVDETIALALLVTAGMVPLGLMERAAAAGLGYAAVSVCAACFDLLPVAALAATLLALYRFGLAQRRRPLLDLVGPALATPFLVLALLDPGSRSGGSAVLTLIGVVAVPSAWLAGLSARAWRDAEESRVAREGIVETLVEHSARGERVRISRELHDVVAHHISMVVVQAETARLAVPGLPADGARRLRAIGDTARAALAEMRRLLAVLREDGDADVGERHPQPGLDQLGALVDEARRASGRPTRLILRGTPGVLDLDAQLAAYRIVQEALSNTRRHAPGAAVDVELRYGAAGLRLRIRDNGPGPGATGGGHGITGMRERAGAAGGTVQVGPATGGGYLVEVVLPFAPDRRPDRRADAAAGAHG